MKQQYFVVVLAHSLHGRLRRVHVPHQFIYAAVLLLLLGSLSMFGFVSSYVRMTLKVSNYNNLRGELEALRERYQVLQRESKVAQEHLATLQLHASEVSAAFGLKPSMDESNKVRAGALVPSFSETLDQYNLLKSASFSRLHRTFAHRWQINIVPAAWPVQGRLMSYYGNREDPFSGLGAFHTGVDISAPRGTPIRATADGVVVNAEYLGSYGKLVIIDHGNGYRTYYAHLSRFDVVPGQEVRRGEIVGRSGATGRATSPHLHYEVRRAGDPVNPSRYLKTTVEESPRRDFGL